MDLNCDDVTGCNLYSLCHAGDVRQLRKAHVDRKCVLSLRYTHLIEYNFNFF